MRLTEQEAKTLADAIDAYRSRRLEVHGWMRLDTSERMSPSELDGLRDKVLSGVSNGTA